VRGQLWGLRLVGGKQASVTVSGSIAPGGCGCTGGGGTPPPPDSFSISVLDRLAWIKFTQPTNGTNLTTCAGSTNDVAVQVTLGDAATPSSGTVTFSSALGTFNPSGAITLVSGAASAQFIASTNAGSGTITATANNLPDGIGGTISGVATSIVANALFFELEFHNSKMTSGRVVDPLLPQLNRRIGVVTGDSITFRAKTTPNVPVPATEYDWLYSTGSTYDQTSITLTFNLNGYEHFVWLYCLNCVQRRTKVQEMEVPTPNEITWAIFHPLSAITANELATEALAWAQTNETSLGGGLHNGKADAARHAYWNGLMVVEMDVNTARGAATAHERTNYEDGGAHNEIVMDLLNNEGGRNLSGITTDRATIDSAVRNALNAGSLTILDDLGNANEVGLLIPSN